MYCVYERYGVCGIRLVGKTDDIREAARDEICVYGDIGDAMLAGFNRTKVTFNGRDILDDEHHREVYQRHLDEQCGIAYSIYTDAAECPDI